MNPASLNFILKLCNLSQSDLARMAGVSRQAVSSWFRKTHSIKMMPLIKLSHGLNISLDDLTQFLQKSDPLDVFTTERQMQLKTNLLWDKLYPTLDGYLIALLRNDLRALARLTQVYGLFTAATIVGGGRKSKIWILFHRYKKFIPPVQRQGQEKIWQLQKGLGLI